MIYNYNNYLYFTFEGVNEIDEIYLMVDQVITYLSERRKEIEDEISEDGYVNFELINMIYNPSDYKIMIPFITNFTLNVELDSDIKRYGSYAYFLPESDDEYVDEGWVIINYNLDLFKRNYKDGLREWKNEDKAFKYALEETFRIVLAHEIQHAYDYYRTKGKFTSDKYTNKYKEKSRIDKEKNIQIKDYNPLYNPDVFKAYLKVPAEVWARFTETVKILDYTLEFKDVLKSFRSKLRGYDILSDKIRKRLDTALYKYYEMKKGS